MPAHSASEDTLLPGHDGCLRFDLTEHSPKKSTSCDSLAVVMLLAHIHNALMEWLAPAPTTSRQRRARKTSDRVRAIGATPVSKQSQEPKESINPIKQNHQPMKEEVRDGIRRKQTKSFRHATRFPQDIGRRRRGCGPRPCALGAVRVERLGPDQDFESAAVESLRSPVRYLVRRLREGLGKTERHHRHCRSHSAPRGTGTRRGGGCGRGRT